MINHNTIIIYIQLLYDCMYMSFKGGLVAAGILNPRQAPYYLTILPFVI